MSIEKAYGDFILVCDICGYTEDGFDDFQGAVDYKRENGWKSKKRQLIKINLKK